VESFLDSAEHMKGVEKLRWGDSTIQALALKMFLDLEEDSSSWRTHIVVAKPHQTQNNPGSRTERVLRMLSA